MSARILAFGEILWDVFDHAKRLGGAPLNFALHARRIGHESVLISAVGKDELGAEARAALAGLGMDSPFIQTTSLYPTGTARVQLGDDGQVHFKIHRPAAYDDIHLSQRDLEDLAAWDPEWLYFGTLSSMVNSSRSLLFKLIETLPHARRFYDVNLRQDSYTPELVAELAASSEVVKMNLEEMLEISRMFGLCGDNIENFCARAAERFGWRAVAVTLGERGCGVWVKGAFAEVEGVPVSVVDPVGAGDAFSAAFVHGLSLGWSPLKIGEFANRVGALVASRPGGTPEWSIEEVEQVQLPAE